MRLIFFIPAFIILSLPLILKGQDILNSGFEDWTTIQYFEDPNGYNTTNTVTYFSGSEANVTKTTDAVSGTYAIRLETVITGDGILEGAAFIGQPGEGYIDGGLPYDERPDSLTGFVKYDVAAGDTAYVAAIFKKFGAPIGLSFAQFIGVQENYTYFSVPVEWGVPIISPDTVAIAIISSSILAVPIAGNVLYADNIQFVGPGDPFPNGDFENWTFYSADEPDDWQSTNILTMPVSNVSVSKTTDSHSGNYAALITTQVTNWNDTLSFVTNGKLGEEGPTGGMPVEDIPNVLSGYYKYAPAGLDTAIAVLTLYHYNNSTGNSDQIDKTILKLPATDIYTYFELSVDYYSLPEPDTVNITFGSSNFQMTGSGSEIGSELFIDDLEITYKPHIVSLPEPGREIHARVYPNPVGETIQFEVSVPSGRPAHIVIYNPGGQKIHELEHQGSGTVQLKVDQWEAGNYIYRITYGDQSFNGKFIVE